MVRNAKDDMAICNKATPGPWKYDGMHNEIQTPRGETYWLIVSECRSAPDQEYPNDPQYDANFDFIAMAREALPYWIERAEKLEKALGRACVLITNHVNAYGTGMDLPMDLLANSRKPEAWKKYFMEEDSR